MECFVHQDEDVQSERKRIKDMASEEFQKQSVVLKDLTKVRELQLSMLSLQVA